MTYNEYMFLLHPPSQDRDTFLLKLEDTEAWLYEDGEDQPKQVYIDKLGELKVINALVCNSVWCESVYWYVKNDSI